MVGAFENGTTGQCEHGQVAGTVQGRTTCAHLSEQVPGHADTCQVIRIPGGTRGDVVSEEFGVLERVGVTPHRSEQRHVVDHLPLVVVHPQLFSESDRDQALAHHVLSGLTQAEVSRQ